MLDRHVRYRVEEAVGWVTLDRPEAMNALSEEVFADLFDVVRAANDDPVVRVLIVTGTGPTSAPAVTCPGSRSWTRRPPPG